MKLTYPACFYKDRDSGGYSVEVPDLPGCASGGDSLAEAILMGIDAASGWALTWMEEGKPLPQPSRMGDVVPDEEGGFVSLLALDLDEYAKKHGGHTVTRTLELPAYLSTFAESEHIDVSRFVQTSLAELYRQRLKS